ncbi:MAG: hypothetical protein IPJ46_13595 [Anaerolineales bacterium]|nr:hypothetical protein [Anaerolineales bacterium]
MFVANIRPDRMEARKLGSALGRDMSPLWAMTTSKPTVFNETVLPPVFGPVMTMARVPGAVSTSTGTTVLGSSSGGRAFYSLIDE